MNFDKKCNILDDRIKRTKTENDFCFVLCDKFGKALRNSIPFIPNIKPDIVIAERGGLGKDELILENKIGVIGGMHYLNCKDIIDSELRKRIGSRKPKFLSWTPREQLADKDKFLCLQDKVRTYVENKTNLATILCQAGVDVDLFTLKHDVFASKEHIPAFSVLTDKYGTPFVLQGWSKGGDGTIIVESVDDFKRKEGLSGEIRVSEFCDQQYGSIYACVVPTDEARKNGVVIMDRPGFKVVGVSQHGVSDVLGGGCNWGQKPDIDLEETKKNVEKIGLYLLRRFGYVGSLVLEGFFVGGRFVFNEINARLGGGNEVSGFNQIMHGEIPIQAIHYALQLGIPCHDLVDQYEFHEKHFSVSVGGCFYFKLIGKGNTDFRVGKLRDGSYCFSNGRLVPDNKRSLPCDTMLRGNRITLSNLPQSPTLCKRDAHICMVEGLSGVADQLITGPKDVSGLVLQISNLVYNSIVYV